VEGANNTNTVQHYTFIDTRVSQTVTYYRIRQVDQDGLFSYSKVISIKSQSPGNLVVRGSFAGDQLIVSIYSNKANAGNLELYDAAGKKIAAKKLTVAAGMNHPAINTGHLAAGIYYLKLQINNEGVKTITLSK
jgi:hypothetical protein